MTFLIAVAGIIGLIWTLAFCLRGSLLLGCVGFLVTCCCFGYDFASFDVGPLPLTIDRLALAVLVGAYVIHRWMGRTDPKPLGRDDWLVFGLVGLIIVNMIWHGWRMSQPGAVSPIWRLLAGYLIPLAIYWVARQSVLTQRKVWQMHVALAVFGLYLVVTGLFEATGQWSLVFPHYIADPKVGLHFGRVRGPMVQAVSCGTYLVTALLCTWYVARSFGRIGWLALGVLAPVYTGVIFFTLTRSVWLGFAAAVTVLLGVTLSTSWRTLFLAGATAAGLIIAITASDAILGFEREGSAAETRDSASIRTRFAYVSWKMFEDRPLWGCGFGKFSEAKFPYLSDRSTKYPLETLRELDHHNTFLSVLTETGLFGFLLLLALFGAWLQTCWRLWRSGDAPPWMGRHGALTMSVLILVACQMLFHELSYSPVDNALLFLMTGVASGLAATIRRRDAETLASPHRQSDADVSLSQRAEPAVVG